MAETPFGGMFGSDYATNFGLPAFPFENTAHNNMFGPGFSGMEQGQPVPGTPGAEATGAVSGGLGAGAPAMRGSAPDAGIGPSANPSVDALRTGNPLAVGAGGLNPVGGNNLVVGAGAAPQPGAGAPAMSFVGGGGRGV